MYKPRRRDVYDVDSNSRSMPTAYVCATPLIFTAASTDRINLAPASIQAAVPKGWLLVVPQERKGVLP